MTVTSTGGGWLEGSVRRPLRIVLADDAYLVREALKVLLTDSADATVVAECGDGRLVERMIDDHRADVLITDIRMPPRGEDEGIELAARLRATHPALGVVVLSTYADVRYAIRLFDAGSDSRAYLLKDRIGDRSQLLAAAQAVARGGSVIDPRIVEEAMRTRGAGPSPLERLTSREVETLALVAQGRSNAAIADQLVLSKRAIEKHINAIFAKLELGDSDLISRRVSAALLYLADGEASAESLHDSGNRHPG
jgi:DNA-binding NarL/FixJ family response regulator